jgi:hypothetical protein
MSFLHHQDASALGEYIMSLGVDIGIRPTYIEKAIAVLDVQSEVDVVYGKSALFGEIKSEHYNGYSLPFDPVTLY